MSDCEIGYKILIEEATKEIKKAKGDRLILLNVVKEAIDLLQVDGGNTKKQALKLLQETYNINNKDTNLDD